MKAKDTLDIDILGPDNVDVKEIKIRPYNLDDAYALYEAAKESGADIYQWMPWCHPGYRLAEAEDWLSLQMKNQATGIEYEFAILNQTDFFLGGCGLNEIDWDKKTANLGYWVRSSATGQGVAVRAVGLLADWAFDCTELTHLEIKCAVDNIRSQRVAEKAGAAREGIRPACIEFHAKKHDAVIYSIRK